jgi:hypothetical protein
VCTTRPVMHNSAARSTTAVLTGPTDELIGHRLCC